VLIAVRLSGNRQEMMYPRARVVSRFHVFTTLPPC